MIVIYRVIIAPEAQQALEVAYYWIEERAPQQAEAWINGFMTALHSLSEMPSRCPLAPETVLFNQEIRHLLYGKAGYRYRALFSIDANSVNVLHIRHYAQDWIRLKVDSDF